MKNKGPKILLTFFIVIFILQIIGLFILFFYPLESLAEDVVFKPQVAIGDYKGETINKYSIGNYILAVYKYAITIVGVLATVIMMYGGLKWLTSGGSSDKISDARAWIGASLGGLILVLSSYLILSVVNPELVKIKPIGLKKVDDNQIEGTNTTKEEGCVSLGGEIINTNSLVNAESSCGIKCKENYKPLTVISNQKYCCVCNTAENNTKDPSICEGKNDGDVCAMDGASPNAWCYGEQCLVGDGGENDDCGNSGQGKCKPISWGMCPSGWNADSGGRSCQDSLKCCEPD